MDCKNNFKKLQIYFINIKLTIWNFLNILKKYLDKIYVLSIISIIFIH